MSLIEEALKKQQEEFGDSSTTHKTETPAESHSGSGMSLKKPEPPLPSTEDPPPPPPSEETAKPGLKTLLPIIILVTACLVLLGVSFWLISAGVLKKFMSPKAAQSVPAATSKPAAVPVQPARPLQPPAQPATSTSAAIPPPAAVSSPKAPSTTAPGLSSTAQPAISTPAAVHPAPGSPTPTQPAIAPPPTAKKPVVILDDEGQAPARSAPVTVKEAPVWPTMNITGLINADGANGAVFIHGQLISVGETYEGVKILSVGRNSIKASFEGEIRTLKVGGK